MAKKQSKLNSRIVYTGILTQKNHPKPTKSERKPTKTNKKSTKTAKKRPKNTPKTPKFYGSLMSSMDLRYRKPRFFTKINFQKPQNSHFLIFYSRVDSTVLCVHTRNLTQFENPIMWIFDCK